MMDINRFNSFEHVKEQCTKIESLTHRRINPEKVNEMNIMLFNRYYRLKPKNMSDSIFLSRLSLKSIYDVCDKVIEEEKRKGRPINMPQKSSINNKPKVMQQQNNQQIGIGVNGEKVNMQYQRTGSLQQNMPRAQAVNYQSMIKDLGVGGERPNEEEVMSQIKENQSSWLNTRKARDNGNNNTQPLQQPMNNQTLQPNTQPQFNPQQPLEYKPIPQPQQMQMQQPNDFAQQAAPQEGFDLNNFGGGLLDGISAAEKAKFEGASGSVVPPAYSMPPVGQQR